MLSFSMMRNCFEREPWNSIFTVLLWVVCLFHGGHVLQISTGRLPPFFSPKNDFETMPKIIKHHQNSIVMLYLPCILTKDLQDSNIIVNLESLERNLMQDVHLIIFKNNATITFNNHNSSVILLFLVCMMHVSVKREQ